MWRMGRVLAVLVFGCCVLLTPPSVAETPQPNIEIVQAQEPPPGPDLREPGTQQQPDRQEIAIGMVGIGLILLVLLSRKLRKKPVLFFHWKKKG